MNKNKKKYYDLTNELEKRIEEEQSKSKTIEELKNIVENKEKKIKK
jgi:hypothetical protein